jgi:uncharacterized SAM-binding protein YcdF (DUF218 family)
VSRPLTRPDRPSAVRSLAIVALAAGVSTAGVLGYGAFRIWQRGEMDEARPADAIVVLGAAQYDGRPSPVFEARLDHAVDLYRRGIAPVLIVTGGGREGDRTTEAAAARAYAERNGVPPAAILGEDRARNTQESIVAVAAILRDHGMRSAVFVSDRTHMLRVLRMAKDVGVEAYGSPTASSPSDATLESRLEATVHELGALIVYALSGTGSIDSSAITDGAAGPTTADLTDPNAP